MPRPKPIDESTGSLRPVTSQAQAGQEISKGKCALVEGDGLDGNRSKSGKDLPVDVQHKRGATSQHPRLASWPWGRNLDCLGILSTLKIGWIGRPFRGAIANFMLLAANTKYKELKEGVVDDYSAYLSFTDEAKDFGGTTTEEVEGGGEDRSPDFPMFRVPPQAPLVEEGVRDVPTK
ncbi:hypothetical protein NE237_026470 [Protea cynaroides]|uniref:Uncharacterized protein n=1 Tax=Protea cynaroides TaxID=273540 RepID=A0A9Q0K0I6_9MAGN|nr:hypothetical protein NE237_026470 [Protea cynaroides]